MIALFASIAYKLKVGQKIEDMTASIKSKVEESDAIKEEAKKDFQNIADSLEHIEDELKAIVDKAEQTANNHTKFIPKSKVMLPFIPYISFKIKL